MKTQFFKHPWRSIKYRFYYKFYYKSAKHFQELVESDIRKAIEVKWLITYGKKFPWDRPVTLNEKITWLSGMTDTSEWSRLADKYEVRNYIKKIGLDNILTECYGIWEHIEDIDWGCLPQKFAIKCTHDCGSTIIVEDKDKLDIEEAKRFLAKHLQERMGYRTCEPHYTKIKPRVMAEELIDFDMSVSSSIVDYKFWVLNGKADYCMTVYDRGNKVAVHGYMLDLYTTRPWTQTEGLIDDYKLRLGHQIAEPKNLDKMIEYAEIISKGFPQVRVDMYNVNGKIYFGEMTFTSQGGRMSYFTPEFQKVMGDAITLPSETK